MITHRGPETWHWSLTHWKVRPAEGLDLDYEGMLPVWVTSYGDVECVLNLKALKGDKRANCFSRSIMYLPVAPSVGLLWFKLGRCPQSTSILDTIRLLLPKGRPRVAVIEVAMFWQGHCRRQQKTPGSVVIVADLSKIFKQVYQSWQGQGKVTVVQPVTSIVCSNWPGIGKVTVMCRGHCNFKAWWLFSV